MRDEWFRFLPHRRIDQRHGPRRQRPCVRPRYRWTRWSRAALYAIAVALLWTVDAPATAENRAVIKGHDLLLDGKPYIPYGMMDVSRAQISKLKELGINSLSIDVSFKDFDPRKTDAENRTANADLIEAADAAHANGMTVLWLFSFHYTPDWLRERYPDVAMKKFDGSDGRGGWITMCLNHPGFRSDAEKWLSFIVPLLSAHPATIGYVMWNEPHLTAEVDYNPHTVKAFRAWVAARYPSVEEVNRRYGSRLKSLDELDAPAPQANTRWFEVYDRMVTGEGTAAATRPSGDDTPPLWMDWMRFRQENFTDFWAWEASVIKRAAPDALVTSKIVPFDLYSSHAYGAGTNTEQWASRCLDTVGMDLYSHLDENFLARWKSDYFQSLGRGKPIWHTEMNLSFIRERGISPPEQWRAAMYYQLSRGVNGFWNYSWNAGNEYSLHYTQYRPAPVTEEIARIGKELKTLAPLLQGAKPARAQVAILHSTATGLARPGDYAPTADQTTVIDMLYRSQTPFQFVTEDMVRAGALADYRVLVVVGAWAVPTDVLDQIARFTRDSGGNVLANAGFASLDGEGRPRAAGPGSWMGVEVRATHRVPREKTGTLELRRQARTIEDKPVDVRVAMETYSARPILLNGGGISKSGSLFGNEDAQMSWSCQDRHEMYWEDVDVLAGATTEGRFEDGKPAMVATRQTLYIARDMTWVDGNFESLIQRFLDQSGVLNANAVTSVRPGQSAASVDLRAWDGPDRRILFVINSPRTLDYDGTPVEVDVSFDAYGELTDALTGAAVASKWDRMKRVVRLQLKAGEVRVLTGKPYPEGWRNVRAQYDELKQQLRPTGDSPHVWRKNPQELVTYDGRTEVGVGVHDLSDAHIQLVKKLGIRLVRYTVYWDQIERTANAGQYDEERLREYDQTLARARDAGLELLLVVHGNPPGVDWDHREAAYARFTSFMSMLVRRYPSIQYWELWNEMDASFTPIFGARREGYPLFERGRCYGQMLNLAYPAIKQANPQSIVLMGGLASHVPEEFIRGVYEEGAGRAFDVMSIHTYGVPVNTGMLVKAYRVKAAMARYGDGEKPLWNTEFGIDAGNMWQAWKWTDGQQFDKGHLEQWQTCIQEAKQYGLYTKVLGYQFHAKNEAENGEMEKVKETFTLAAGYTFDDYGCGLLRRDGATPRPTYQWLLKSQVNRSLHVSPKTSVDVIVADDGSGDPQGYAFDRRDGKLYIRGVTVGPDEPVTIKLRRP